MKILVTGGCGYIGSHAILELLQADHAITVIDNLSNSSTESITRVEKLSGRSVNLHVFDLRDTDKLRELFTNNRFDSVIHFAGLKSVGASNTNPLEYYDNNIGSTLALCRVMEEAGVKNLVFSSSATVYGIPQDLPLTENSPLSATNPYGQTKLMIEQILADTVKTRTGWDIISLRYFNPIGAHASGLIGEDPNGTPNNLLPYITQVAIGKLTKLMVYGDDYDTPDGTGVRDYIHVVDLARAHVAAINHLTHPNAYRVFNVGTGKGVSVLELVAEFEKVSGKKIAVEVTKRRLGDVASCYADPGLANQELGWEATHSLEDACVSAWKWQSRNPNGYSN